MKSEFIKGIIPPIITPIDENEIINEKKLKDQVDFIINGGCHGILAFGSNGEFYMLDEATISHILKIIISAVDGRVPVYMGIGAIRTSQCIRLAGLGIKMGASAISLLPPMFIKPSDEELYYHIFTIAMSIPSTPMLLYNNPGRVGYGIPIEMVSRLAHEVENIVGIKDSSGDLTVTAELIRMTRDIDFKVLSGKDTLIYATLLHGGSGAVATTANFVPRLVSSIYENYLAGNIKQALDYQYKLNPIRMSMNKASFPVASKAMANLLGRDIGKPFLPNLLPTEEQISDMRKALLEANL